MMQARVVLMQVPGWLCVGSNGLMQMLACSDAGPQMLGCRSSDDAIQVPGCKKTYQFFPLPEKTKLNFRCTPFKTVLIIIIPGCCNLLIPNSNFKRFQVRGELY